MRRRVVSVVMSSLAVLAAACSGDPPPVAGPLTDVTEQAAPAPSAPASDPVEPAQPPVEYGGDALKNKACALATVAEIQEVTGYTVWKVEGLPVGFRGDLGCIWRFVAVDYGGPALTVTWDRNDTDAAGKTALFRQLIADKQRSEVRGIGDVATQDGSSIDVISGRQWLYVTLRLRQIATPADQRMNREMLDIVFPRTQG